MGRLARTILLLALAPATARAAFDPAAMREQPAIAALEVNPFTRHVIADDLDQDGLPEIVLSTSYSWAILEHEPPSSWRIRRQTETTDPSLPFGFVLRGDLAGDGSRELILTQATSLRLHDAETGDLLAVAPAPAGVPRAIADLEPSPGDEMVSTSSGLRVSNLADGLLWSLPGIGDAEIAVGQLDADPSLEIVSAGTFWEPAAVVDAATRAIQWTMPERLGWVSILDLDGDGIGEIASGGSGETVLWDAVTQSARWRSLEETSHALAVDADGDGDLDLVSHSGALDGATGALLFRINAGQFFDVADFDGDCSLDIAFASDPNIIVRGLRDTQARWTGARLFEPPGSVSIVDVDADGALETLVACYETRGAVTADWLHVHDLRGREERVPPLELPGLPDQYALVNVGAAQLDADPQLEILSTSWGPTTLHATDSTTGLPQWSLVMAEKERATCFHVGGAPGAMQIVVGLTAMTSSESIGSQVRLVDAATGLETWRSRPLGSRKEVRDVRAVDLDGDGDLEVIAALEDSGLYILRPPDEVPALTAPGSASCLDLADVDRDGDLELLTGTKTGEVIVRDAVTLATLRVLDVGDGSSRVRAVTVADVDGDGVNELVLAQGAGVDHLAKSRLVVASPVDGSTLWQSDMTWGDGSEACRLVVADADGDGAKEIAIATATSVRFFEHRGAAPDAAPPVFSAGTLSVTPRRCCGEIDLAWPAATDAESAPTRFEIHRSTDPGFTPDSASLLTLRDGHAYRDVSAPTGVDATYAVIPVDAAGNRGAEMRTTVSPLTASAPPNAPTAVVAVDENPCERTGVVVTFAHDGLPAGVVYDVLVDGEVRGEGITSPHVVSAIWTGAHDFVIVARDPECGLRAESAPAAAEDLRDSLDEPWLVDVVDLDPCAASGVSITFTHPGFPAGGHYELVDGGGAVLAPSITSPWTHVPPGDQAIDYAVRAVRDDCAQSEDSWSEEERDLRGEPGPPIVSGVIDLDPCTRGPVRVSYSAPDRPPLVHFDVLKDGVPWLTGLPWFAVQFTPEDGLPHDYVLRLVDEACGVSVDSAPFIWTDIVTPCMTWPSIPLGAEPVGIAGDPVRPVFYVATVDGMLSKIDVASASIVAAISVGAELGDMVATPDGARLFVAKRQAGHVAVIDLATFSVETTIDPGGVQGVKHLAIKPGRLYVSCDDGLAIINTATLGLMAFHPMAWGILRDSRIALSPDGNVIYALDSWSPSSLYAYDVTGDRLAAVGEDCCHGCIGPGSLIVSSLTGQPIVNLKVLSTEGIFHDDRSIPVLTLRGQMAQSRDGRLLLALNLTRVALIDGESLLPWRNEQLPGNPSAVALSGDETVAGVTLDNSVALITLTGLAPTLGGVRLRTLDARSGIEFRANASLAINPNNQNVLSVVDVENGVTALSMAQPGANTLLLPNRAGPPQAIPVDIVAGAWTDVGDVPRDLLSPPVTSNPVCVSPALRRGERQVVQVNARDVRPGCTVSFSDSRITVHSTAYRTWSVLDVDVTVAPDLPLGLGAYAYVTDTGGSMGSGGVYWVEDAPSTGDSMPPAEVTGLLVRKVAGDIELTWNPVTTDGLGSPETMGSYEVLREINPLTFGATAWMTAPAPPLLWSSPPSEPGVLYFLVRAVDAAGNTGPER